MTRDTAYMSSFALTWRSAFSACRVFSYVYSYLKKFGQISLFIWNSRAGPCHPDSLSILTVAFNFIKGNGINWFQGIT
jgi:hypothetical protein